jgi:hypothetical protein
VNPRLVHERTVQRSTDAGRQAFLLREAAAYRAAKNRSRRLRWRIFKEGRSRTREEWAMIGALRSLADHHLDQVRLRDPELAGLLVEEHGWHLLALVVPENHLGPDERAQAACAVELRRRILVHLGAPSTMCAMCGELMIHLAGKGWQPLNPRQATCHLTHQWDDEHIPVPLDGGTS